MASHLYHSFRRSVTPSPPDTANRDSTLIPPLPGNPGPDLDPPSATTGHFSGATPERAKYQPRRTLSYQNSGTRALRDARGPKNLVVVIPPRDFPLEQGPLGNVLSMGPRHRLTQGMLMPLFPSMFGQLNAIAREYNFPSTVGLCLYLHINVNEHGISMTPRISDESWQYLFGHLFEDRLSSLPIGGTIEFDIDLNKARWFDAWASGAFRESEPPVPQARAFTESHWRKESHPTDAGEPHAEDRWYASWPQTPVGNTRPTAHRHVPKKLSLVERLESRGALASPKLQIPSHPPSLVHALSPIPQSAAPPASKSELEQRVHSWRETTEPFPEVYQPVADVAVPTGVAIEHVSVHNSQQGKVDEYHWSVTSPGPQSPVMESPVTPSRLSSIHLDRRANGSVPLTPVTITSWGPADDDWYSDISSLSLPPSPDLGERAIEDIMAPRPRAVWGNSFGWRFARTWNDVYPFSAPQTKPPQNSSDLVPQYPDLVIYPTVDATESSPQSVHLDSTVTVQPVAPAQLHRPGGLDSKYPNIGSHLALYPHFDIYPSVVAENIEMKVSSQLDTSMYGASNLYPNLVIYAAVYPHFDLYPAALQIGEMHRQKEVKLDVNGPEFPSAPTQDVKKEAISVVWDVSFGWLSGKTWLQAYPFNAANPLTRRPVGDRSPESLAAGAFTKRQGNSFRWKSATTWGAAQPTPLNGVRQDVVPISVRLGQQDDSLSSYPYLVIYPAAYPHFNIYPRAVVVETKESQIMWKDQGTVNPIPRYPDLVIYPAVYPHLDVYPTLGRVSVSTEEQPNRRRRRIDLWRAKTPAQVGLPDPLGNNHMWEAEEPPRIDLADSPSRSPPTFPLDVSDTSPIAGSVDMGGLIQGSVPLTTTTWDPQDGDWCPDIFNVEQLPLPDLDQRIPHNVEKTESSYETYPVWPFVEGAGQVNTTPSVLEKSSSESVLGYPYLVIYTPVYPYFEPYPTLSIIPTLKNEVLETPANLNIYPHLDIYPAVYPHFNIYPTSILRIESPSGVDSNIRHGKAETRLPFVCADTDIYDACHPHNLDCIYPSGNVTKSTQLSVEHPRGYPRFVIYPPVYPYIIPYPGFSAEIDTLSKADESLSGYSNEWKSVDVKLPAQYPMFYPYPAVYPWSLASIYPTTLVDDSESMGAFKLQSDYSPVHPFVQPYPSSSSLLHAPGSLDKGAYESAKAFLALLEHNASLLLTPLKAGAEQNSRLPASLPKMGTTPRRQRKTHMELHTSVFLQFEKRRPRDTKTHLQLHTEVFQDRVVWTPSGYMQDLVSFTTKKQEDIQGGKSRRRTSQDNSTFRPLRSRLPTRITASTDKAVPDKAVSDKAVFPFQQPSSLPVRVRSSGTPPHSPPAVTGTPVRRVSQSHPLVRTTSSRFSSAIKPTVHHRHSSSGALASLPHQDHKEPPKDPQSPSRPLGRWPPGPAPPSGQAKPPGLLTRIPSQTKESSVLQRARAYEEATTAKRSSGSSSTKGTPSHSPFASPRLRSMLLMTEVTETIQV